MAGSALSQGGCGYAKSSRAQIRSSRGLRHGGCRRPVLESSWRPIRRPAVSMYAPSKRISGTATGDLIQGWLRGAVNKVVSRNRQGPILFFCHGDESGRLEMVEDFDFTNSEEWEVHERRARDSHPTALLFVHEISEKSPTEEILIEAGQTSEETPFAQSVTQQLCAHKNWAVILQNQGKTESYTMTTSSLDCPLLNYKCTRYTLSRACHTDGENFTSRIQDLWTGP